MLNEGKRKLSLNNVNNTKKKKLKCQMKIDQEITKITSIEDFSNELFYKIFDYLGGCIIYEAFSNLNYRFQQLLNSSYLLFKIRLIKPTPGDLYVNNLKKIIQYNKQQIFSMKLCWPLLINEFLSSITINSTYDRLESLTIWAPKSDILMALLPKLTSLSRLFSLEIYMTNVLINQTDVFRLIFTLPMLKDFTYTSDKRQSSISLPIATNKQFSPIQVLYIDIACTFKELAIITSYTPQLRSLDFGHNRQHDPIIEILFPDTLSNLKHLVINESRETFDEFEIFISKICQKLESLCILTLMKAIIYFDAKRWEELILKYCPQLKDFVFQYDKCLSEDDYDYPIHHIEPNQFTSPFWIERKWIFESEISEGFSTYRICSHGERWYTQHKMVNSPIQISKSSQLTLSFLDDDGYCESVIEEINYILTIQQIYHLEITKKHVFSDDLIGIIKPLRELISLKIHSLFTPLPEDLPDEEDSSNKEDDFVRSVVDTSKITDVYLEEMDEMDEVYFLMELCPCIRYLKVGYINKMGIERVLRNILEKINLECNAYLRLLCFHVDAADDEVIKTLEQMIHDENLLIDYTIKREFDNIYLKWK